MKKGQLKIQQMAFVLMAIMIFFAMVALFYFSLTFANLKENAESLRQTEVLETIRKISASPEFSWQVESCSSCIDMDKAFLLKDRKSYEDFWDFSLIKLVKVNSNGVECTRENYPECGEITLIDSKQDVIAYSSFVALCSYNQEGYNQCELGKIIMGFKPVQ